MKTLLKMPYIIGVMLVLTVTSCKEDEPDVVIDDRDAFVGTWNVSDQTITKQNYQVYIYKDENNSDKIWMKNFHGTSDTSYAYIEDKNITILAQTLSVSHLTTAGSGIMTGTTKIDFEYYVNDGAQQDTIIARYTK
jgi:hypothetical protein